jgi:hypothetical protein
MPIGGREPAVVGGGTLGARVSGGMSAGFTGSAAAIEPAELLRCEIDGLLGDAVAANGLTADGGA